MMKPKTKKVGKALTLSLLVPLQIVSLVYGVCGSASAQWMGAGAYRQPMSTPCSTGAPNMGCGSFCPTPQFPAFNPAVGMPPMWGSPAYVLPGFTYGLGPIMTMPAIETYADFSTGSSPQTITPSGQSSSDRIEKLMPTLKNSDEIPDTRGSSGSDMGGVIGDVFKSSQPSAPDTSSNASKDEDDCKKAVDLCKNKNFKEARDLMNRAIQSNPNCYQCFYLRAHANLNLGDRNAALNDAKQAVALNPKYAPGHFVLGVVLSEQGKLQDALAAYNAALEINPKYQKCLSARGNVNFKLTQFVPAIKDYEAALALQSDDPTAQFMRGQSYYMIGQYQMVIKSLSQFLALNPNNAEAYLNRGSAYYELAQYENAIGDFNRALELDPKSVDSLYKRCFAKWYLGQWQPALVDAKQALSVAGWSNPNSAYLALCVYLGYLKSKDMVNANLTLTTALEKLDKTKWPYPLFLYFKGTVTEDQLVAKASTPAAKTQANAYMALHMSWSGKKGLSSSYLQKVRTEGDTSVPEYNLAIAELFRGKVKDTVNVGRPIKRKYALVVGISKFADDKINLKYADKDAQDFYNYLVNEGHFKKENVKLLLNQDATREAILSNLGDQWLPRVANSDDLVVVFISTHGSPSEMDAKGVNYIVAHNTDRDSLYATGIPIQDLTRMVKGRIHADRVVVLLDACHSGAAEDGGKGLLREKNLDAQAVAIDSGQAVICSSRPDELSWESKQYNNGVFTHHLIAGLRLKGVSTPLQDAFDYTRDHVENEVKSDRKTNQTPLMKSTWSRANVPLAVPEQTGQASK